MKGRVVLVTGASGGLGSYVTQAFLNTGATVVGTSRKIQQSDFSSANFTAIPGEISTQAAANVLVDNRHCPLRRLDVLAHTVGGFAGGETVANTDDGIFERMFDLNVNSFFHILRVSIPSLRSSGNGRIIAIGSRAAVEPGVGVGAYSTSKAAMVSLVKTVAAQVANDVRGIQPSFQVIAGQEFDRAEPVFLILPVRLEIVFALAPQSRQASSENLGSKVAVHSRYTMSGSFRFLQGLGERPGPCKYYVSLYAIFL